MANKCHPQLPHFCKNMCQKCYMKAYRGDPQNKVKAKEAQKAWHENNREYVNQKSREWELAHSETVKETKRKYVRKNLHKYRFYCAKRHAAKLQRTPTWSDMGAIRVFYLNCPEGKEVDHIVPLQGENVSGLHILDNLQYLTREENRKKHNKFEGQQL